MVEEAVTRIPGHVGLDAAALRQVVEECAERP